MPITLLPAPPPPPPIQNAIYTSVLTVLLSIPFNKLPCLAIRADEAHHRIVNHTLGSMKPADQNPFRPGAWTANYTCFMKFSVFENSCKHSKFIAWYDTWLPTKLHMCRLSRKRNQKLYTTFRWNFMEDILTCKYPFMTLSWETEIFTLSIVDFMKEHE